MTNSLVLSILASLNELQPVTIRLVCSVIGFSPQIVRKQSLDDDKEHLLQMHSLDESLNGLVVVCMNFLVMVESPQQVRPKHKYWPTYIYANECPHNVMTHACAYGTNSYESY